MSSIQTHIIGCQIIEAEVPGDGDGRQWQERFSRFAKEVFLPQLAMLFDRYSKPDEIIRIEKIELGAELLNCEDWERLLLEDLLQKVTRVLLNPGAEGAQITATDEGLLDQFFFFLKNGSLPWHSPVSVKQDFEGSLLEVLAKKKGTITARWIEEFHRMMRSEGIRKRLVAQFSPSVLMAVAGVFYQQKEAELSKDYGLFSEVFCRAGIPVGEFSSAFWAEALEGLAGISSASGRHGRQVGETFFQKVLLRFLKEKPQWELAIAGLFVSENQEDREQALWLPFLQKLLGSLHSSPTRVEVLAAWLKKQPGNFAKLAALPSGAFGISEANPTEMQPSALKAWLAKFRESTSWQEEPEKSKSTGEKQALRISGTAEIYVGNAGMVLLHPFLPAFFEELNLVKDGQIVNGQRAVHLLQYLATGQVNTSEFELPLNKVLCGLPLAEPLSRMIHLTQKEKKEAKKLLQAVIRHWGVLKNTSTEALQGTYLCREGKLSRRGSEDWQLQVEQKAFDVLLADLPWTISMIKLPWMQGMLWIEWQ